MRKLDLRLMRDLAALSGGELLSKIVGFLGFAYLARVLGPEAYGAVELAVSLALFFALVVDFGLGPIGARQLTRDGDRANALAAQIPAARLLLALVAMPLMCASAYAMGQPSQTVELVALFAVGLLAAPWLQRWLFQGLERMGWISPAQPIRMIVFVLGVVLLVRGPSDLMKVGWVEIVSAAAMATYYLVVQHSQIAPVRLSFQWRALRRLLGEGLSLGLGQVVWALNQYLSTLLVAVFLGSEQIAYFGAAGRIVLSLGTFMHLYHFNLFPAVSKSLHASTGSFLELTRPSLRITSWLGIGVALPASFVATPLCQLAFGEAFGAAGPALAIVVWTLPTILVAGHARFALIASGHQRYVLASQLAGVVATLVLGLLLIPPLGPVGAGVAMLASFLAVWLASAWFTSRAVVRIPFTAYLSRPCAAAVAAAGAVRCLGLTGWWAGLCAGVVYFAAAALLDRAIFRDARQLAESKGTQPDQP